MSDQFSHWSEAAEGQTPPRCSACRKPVRKAQAAFEGLFPGREAQPPWNAKWDGICEACGYRYEVTSRQIIIGKSERKMAARPASRSYKDADYAVILAGIELEIDDAPSSATNSIPGTVTKIFISRQELQALSSGLNNESSILLQQYDWDEDGH